MRVLGIFVHREDHVVCGWPWMQDRSTVRGLFRCTGDYDEVVQKSCAAGSIVYTGNAGLENGFTLARRRFALAEARDKILMGVNGALRTFRPDVIATHNPWGEYGHGDHRWLFSVVFNCFCKYRVEFSDMIAGSSYYDKPLHIPREFRPLYRGTMRRAAPDERFQAAQAAIFSDAGAWTGNEELSKASRCRVVAVPGVPK